MGLDPLGGVSGPLVMSGCAAGTRCGSRTNCLWGCRKGHIVRMNLYGNKTGPELACANGPDRVCWGTVAVLLTLQPVGTRLLLQHIPKDDDYAALCIALMPCLLRRADRQELIYVTHQQAPTILCMQAQGCQPHVCYQPWCLR